MFTFHHISLSVTNITNSLKFYEILGFKEVLRWKADDESVVGAWGENRTRTPT